MAKKAAKKYVPIDLNQLSHQSETLLANIRFCSIDDPVKTVVITSTGVDEGKSTTAYALALAMARSGKRTLLMDCDMRRRCLGKIMNLHTEGGIYAVLSGRAPLKHCVVPTNTPNLHFLDCEPNIVNPSDMLSTKRFAALMATLRNVYDYVVIDTPPLGLFVDAAVVAGLADGTIVVARQEVAKRAALIDAIDQLNAANARILGPVLTFAKHSHDDYYYYHSYYNEDNKRIKKQGQNGDGDFVEVATSRREFDEQDISNWAKHVGVSLEAADNQAKDLSRRSNGPAALGAHAGGKKATPQNPFSPGSFKRDN